MASLALTDAYVVVNSVNLSAFVKSVTLNLSAAELDDTAMGDTYTSRIGGLKDGSISLTFNQDFASSAVSQSIDSLLGTVVTFEIRPTSSSVGTTNPKWTGSLLVTENVPVAGTVGDLAAVSVTWPTSGTVTRATA